MNYIKSFFKLEAATGILLCISALIAIVCVNSPLSHWYEELLHQHISLGVASFHLDMSLHHFVNDALMAVFFLLVGLEIKKELCEGELSSLSKVALPAIAAAGGMAIPALIYVAFNFEGSESLKGWAIPAATDIAFALGVLSLLGKRVPTGLKVFLLALAIFDDLGAIVIIALFYSSELSLGALAVAAALFGTLLGFGRLGIQSRAPYFVVGLFLWYAVFQSGLHATIAGVLLALTIPLKGKDGHSPLHELEHDLQPWVNFMILPIFGFTNAGVPLAGASLSMLVHPVALGTGLGLFLGKQLGIFGASWLAFKFRIASMPTGANWKSFYGVCVLGGIGFTMSLFVSMLAFQSAELMSMARIGIVLGSLGSAALGFVLVRQGLLSNAQAAGLSSGASSQMVSTVVPTVVLRERDAEVSDVLSEEDSAATETVVRDIDDRGPISH